MRYKAGLTRGASEWLVGCAVALVLLSGLEAVSAEEASTWDNRDRPADADRGLSAGGQARGPRSKCSSSSPATMPTAACRI